MLIRVISSLFLFRILDVYGSRASCLAVGVLMVVELSSKLNPIQLWLQEPLSSKESDQCIF